MPVEQCNFEKEKKKKKIPNNFTVPYRLMNIETLQWDTHLCNFFGVSKKLLPEIRSSSEVYGVFANGVLKVCCSDKKNNLKEKICSYALITIGTLFRLSELAG